MDMGTGSNTTMGTNNTMGSSNSSMSMDMGGSCKISMLWNWYTVDTCFLSASWHNNTKAKFAGSVIGVFLLTIAIELVRRMGREYDKRLIAIAKADAVRSTGVSTPNDDSNKGLMSPDTPSFTFMPTWPHQVIRGLLYGSQFSSAFLVMLLGMYYNGYILFAIFIGQTTGYILFGRDTCSCTIDHATTAHCC